MPLRLRRLQRRVADESGQVLVIFVLFVVFVFIGAAAVGIDLGRVYEAQSQYREVAAIAAQAGAQDSNLCSLAQGTLQLTTQYASCPLNPTNLSATAVAEQTLSSNVVALRLIQPSSVHVEIIQTSSGGGGCDYTYTQTCYAYPTVVVSLVGSVTDLGFAQALVGSSSISIHVTAAATISTSATSHTLGEA